MTNKQSQSVSDSSTAIQAARDVNYSAGMSPSQMVEIIDSVQRLVQVYTEQSKNIIEERLQRFREGILEEFSDRGNGKPEAFSEPDFQGALLDAQKAIARSGDESLEEVLVDLVSQKSRCEKRDRLSLTLNDAISKAGSLTGEDFDLLALIFVFKNMQLMEIPHLQLLTEKLKQYFGPLVHSAAEGELAVSYLESHGCLRTSVGGIMNFSGAYEILTNRYPGVLTKGVTEDEMKTVFPEDSPLWASDLLRPSPVNDDLIFIVPGEAKMIDAIYEQSGLEERPGKSYIDLVKQHLMSVEEFYSLAQTIYPEVNSLIDKYDNSGARDANLTSLGMALAHARLSKIDDFNAPLSIWVK